MIPTKHRLFVIFLFIPIFIFGQTKTIKGIVKNSEDGNTLPGATIMVKGTNVGTISDLDGFYELSVNQDFDTIIVSFIGLQTKEVVIGDRAYVEIGLSTESVGLQEVVITAMGIKKEKRALGYSVQELQSKDIVNSGEEDVSKALQGKVAGVTVRQSSGMPGAASNITIRGSSSISLSNQPLYVIDGMPVSSETGKGGITEGSSRSIDVNPDDIESINVLKGPTAAALYGLRASNGVIVITTKSGRSLKKSGQKTMVTINSSFTSDMVTRTPKLQAKYAQGDSILDQYSPYSWGPKIDTLKPYQSQLEQALQGSNYNIYEYPINGTATNTPAIYDNVKSYFNIGNTIKNSVDISSANDFGTYSIGFGATNQSGVMPTTGMDKYNIKFNGLFDLHKKVKLGVTSNYSAIHIDKTPGGNSTANPLFTVYSAPRTYDLKNTPYSATDNPYVQRHYRSLMDNPYWAMENNKFYEDTKRFFGNVNVIYDPFEWLNISYRVGIDNYSSVNTEILSIGSGTGRAYPEFGTLDPSGGKIDLLNTLYNSVNSTFLATVNKQISSKMNFNWIIGNEIFDNTQNLSEVVGIETSIPGAQNINTASNQLASHAYLQERGFAYFTTVTLEYNRMLYFTPSLRADRVSNMPRNNRTFIYPSASLGWVFTELSSLKDNKYLPYGKLRTSYAQVGQAGVAYSTQSFYNRSILSNGFFDAYYTFPYSNTNAFSLNNTLYSDALRPQNTKTFEIGSDLRFFSNRIGVDYTFYLVNADNQIFFVPLAPSSGFSQEYRNAGQLQTVGHEIVLTIKPIQQAKFKWDFITNFSSYRNEVKALSEGIERIAVGNGNLENVGTFAYAGEQYPVIVGTSYVRDADGNIVVDGREFIDGNKNKFYGMPLVGPQKVLGKVSPDFEMSFINSFDYRRFKLTIQADWRQGGYMYSGMNSLIDIYGMSEKTLDRDEKQVLPNAVKGYYDGSGKLIVSGKNDVEINKGKTYYDEVLYNITEAYIYETSYLRLREISLNYTLPDSWIKKSFIKSADIYFRTRNLFLITKFPNFDPESSTSSGNGAGGFEYVALPNTRSIGGGIRLTF